MYFIMKTVSFHGVFPMLFGDLHIDIELYNKV